MRGGECDSEQQKSREPRSWDGCAAGREAEGGAWSCHTQMGAEGPAGSREEGQRGRPGAGYTGPGHSESETTGQPVLSVLVLSAEPRGWFPRPLVDPGTGLNTKPQVALLTAVPESGGGACRRCCGLAEHGDCVKRLVPLRSGTSQDICAVVGGGQLGVSD